ncbi:hypothetical protein [Novosphingobium sp. KN65.2]|uniref:hypothetical protein n=1 Tax=Novosphingobium sp. KN65.2 TaxID=1478134 RepID=UPI0005E64D86|nr:hypothetical protein [Novosphingobium sp. KN65.2]CDO34550.1 hypothetical protein SPHV1_1660003 [Novosphingobium sp. KN65.2]
MTDIVGAWDDLKENIPQVHAKAAEQLWDMGDKLADEITRLRKHAEAMARAAEDIREQRLRSGLSGPHMRAIIYTNEKAAAAYRAEYPDGGERG